jgi:hypothetical protein
MQRMRNGLFSLNRRRLLAGLPLSLGMVVGLVALPLAVVTAQGNSPALTLEVCRANVEPCQNEVSIPENGAVALDLVLMGHTADAAAELALLVGWQFHLQLADKSVAEPAPQAPGGPPVQEQGATALALDGLSPLSDAGNPEGGQYFTVQNRYDAGSGRLDYAVTLVPSELDASQPPGLVALGDTEVALGRVTIRGLAPGGTAVLVGDVAADPFQIVIRDSSGEFHSRILHSGPGALATINVGPVTTPQFSGQIARPEPGDEGPPASYVGELSVSFWPVGAIPPWRGGNDRPAATFHNVALDSQGHFRITDIAPSLLSPGVYDLRVRSRGTLARLAPSVTVPPAGALGVAAPAMGSITLEGLWAGDIDGNNVVDQADLLELQAGFGLLEGQPGFNADADFNGDGVVDVLDFSILARSFGRRGE